MSDARPIVGVEYHVEHETRGKFRLRIGGVEGLLNGAEPHPVKVRGVITDGEARDGARLAGAPGDHVILGANVCTFTPVTCAECTLRGPCVENCPGKPTDADEETPCLSQ